MAFARLTRRASGLVSFPTRLRPSSSYFFNEPLRSIYTTNLRATQPLPFSHPHLFSSSDQLTPGIPATEYAHRRKTLMQKLPNHSIVILIGHPTCYTSQKIFYPFQNSTDFLYLTGLDEPDCVAVLEKDSHHKNGYQFTLFLEDRPSSEVRWSGPCTGQDIAKSIFAADQVYPNSTFPAYFRQLQADISSRKLNQVIYLDSPCSLQSSTYHPAHLLNNDTTNNNSNNTSRTWWRSSISSSTRTLMTRPISPIIQKMRAIKSNNEINVLTQSGYISGKSIAEAIRKCPNLTSEQDLEAYIEYRFKRNGGRRHAYVPVVASGQNACTLHYVFSDMLLKPNQLVLVDAGAQYGYYAADISRTFPTQNKFTPEQRDLYTIVLTVQEECIAMVNNKVSLDEIHHRSIQIMTRELQTIGFDVNEQIVSRELYFHHVGHYLGLDVHDTPTVSRAQRLEVGNVITIEPGIYVSASDRWPSKYVGIGIRIEDNLLVTEGGQQVITKAAPKSIKEIESMQKCNTID